MLFVFLLDLRAALIVAVLIPLSLLASFIYLKLRGMSANLLSMGAVDFGVIVDGGVVIIESILSRLASHEDGEPTHHGSHWVEAQIRIGAQAVVRPTVFALLIIIAAYLPIFMLQRVEGRIFAPMANTVVAALLGALLFSVTLVPVLASFAYRGRRSTASRRVLRWAARIYGPTLRWALDRPFLTLLAAALGLAGTLALVPRLGSEFLPELNEGALYVTFTLPSNISLTEGRTLVPRLTSIFQAQPQTDDGAVPARTPGGRHRRHAHQQPRVLREAQAAGSVAARDAAASAR